MLALGVIYLLVRYRNKPVELAVAAVITGAIGYVLSKIGNRLISSPRPFIVTGHPALIASATDNGFPSDHTLLLATLAAVITVVDRRAGLVFWVLALVVGLARVYAGVHHLLDIAGSLVIAAIALGIYWLARMLWERRQDGQPVS